MLRRFLSPLALVAMALFLTGTDARAVPISPDPESGPVTPVSLVAGFYSSFQSSSEDDEESSGAFFDYYTFSIDAGSNLAFSGDVDPITTSGGLTRLEAHLTKLGSPVDGYPISDDGLFDIDGFLVNALWLAPAVLANAAIYVLTITGDYAAPAAYYLSFTVVEAPDQLPTPTAAPIPPAALLFLTALGGVGWLGRRKARRLTPA